MSLFDSLFGTSDSAAGDQVLQAYFYEAQKYPAFSYASYNDWISYVNNTIPDFVSFVGQLVNSNVASTTISQAADRTQQLAAQSSGQATVSQIVSAAGGRGDTVNLWAAVPDVATQTVSDAATYAVQTAQAAGQGIMSTTALLKYLPWILGAGAALYIFTIAKGQSKALRINR